MQYIVISLNLNVLFPYAIDDQKYGYYTKYDNIWLSWFDTGDVAMEKTKLGISVELMAAAVCFLAAINLLAAVILAIYILIMETDIWLKRTSIKAVATGISFGIAAVVVGIIPDILAIINSILIFLEIKAIELPFPIDTTLISTITILKTIRLISMGSSSLKGQNSGKSKIDTIIDENF